MKKYGENKGKKGKKMRRMSEHYGWSVAKKFLLTHVEDRDRDRHPAPSSSETSDYQ